ncbi:uncharacterized protein LOC133714090 [Rosa rugosa]|uniref:uncharacterized protein LOC133714090 n=1 Tax=Rosa rugosa TaxID=74645 RepID=UPI002B41292C|nr:uncharacterized protein LOC133714090 [Rosa rugosa]
MEKCIASIECSISPEGKLPSKRLRYKFGESHLSSKAICPQSKSPCFSLYNSCYVYVESLVLYSREYMHLVSKPVDMCIIGFVFNNCLAIRTAGLLVTYVALNLMDGHGQHALLYIVPFTLGTFLTLGQMRGDLKVLWTRGEPERPCPYV